MKAVLGTDEVLPGGCQLSCVLADLGVIERHEPRHSETNDQLNIGIRRPRRRTGRADNRVG